MRIENIVFDLGGVLIDWNPRHLYRKIFEDRIEMEYFLTSIASPEWNEKQDAGRPIIEATDSLALQYPQYKNEILAYYGRWEEMLNGSHSGTVDILRDLHRNFDYKLYALTNWSSETFPIALKHYKFLKLFKGIVVSGDEKVIKPERKIYELISDRYDLVAESTVFIDDNVKNVDAAREFGFQVIHFQNHEALLTNLNTLGIRV